MIAGLIILSVIVLSLLYYTSVQSSRNLELRIELTDKRATIIKHKRTMFEMGQNLNIAIKVSHDSEEILKHETLRVQELFEQQQKARFAEDKLIIAEGKIEGIIQKEITFKKLLKDSRFVVQINTTCNGNYFAQLFKYDDNMERIEVSHDQEFHESMFGAMTEINDVLESMASDER